MKNFNLLFTVLAFVFTTVFTGCGADGTDPLDIFNKPIPELSSILQTGSYTTLNTAFTTTTPYWIFNATWGSISYVAPANGVVTEQTATSVKIVHSGRVATKITNLATLVVSSGDRVVTGQVIGVFSTGNVQFQVLFDGNPVCPLSYMSSAFRQSFFAGYTGNPCQQ